MEMLTLYRLWERDRVVGLEWRDEVFEETNGGHGMGDATFWYRMDGTGAVWAVFGGFRSADAVQVELVAVFE
jgi:hypothetical protein